MATPLCILLVDDSDFFLNLESQFLQHTPATILTAKTSDDALSAARENLPSLVYMDINMPGTDGLTCCRQFKQDRDLKEIPIVLIGDKANESDRSLADDAGSDAYLDKPIDRRCFLEIGHGFLYSIDRREPRKEVTVPVTMTCMGHVSQVEGIDISTGGMFVACQTKAPLGDFLLLQFEIPGSQGVKVMLRGRIAWINIAGEGRKPHFPDGYGVEFIDVADDVGIALRRYLA